MKRYISSILIPCLLLQLFGCYSFKDITIDELREYKETNEIKIKSNQKEVLLKENLERLVQWTGKQVTV